MVNRSWQFCPVLTSEQRLDVLDLLNRTEALLSREAIDESRRRIVVHGWPAEHWLFYDDEGVLLRYAMLDGVDRCQVEMCGGGVDEELLTTILSMRPSVEWWTRGEQRLPTQSATVLRTLQLLSAPLPVATTQVPEGAVLRNFVSGRDELQWLSQNNAAFADHPEQGAWSRADLDERTHEPWFDPSGFLLLEIDGVIAASCWTKVHELHPDRFGEIYVISVHPGFQGRNLGRVMVTQGLDVLRRKGVNRASLFVDETNDAARALYESLGFTLLREDRLIRFDRI